MSKFKFIGQKFGCHIDYAFLGTCDIRYFWNKPFLTSRPPLLNTFTTKSYLRSETYTAYKFYALYTQTTALLGEFLFVRRKCHARLRSVFSLYQVIVQDYSSHMGLGLRYHIWPKTFCTENHNEMLRLYGAQNLLHIR